MEMGMFGRAVALNRRKKVKEILSVVGNGAQRAGRAMASTFGGKWKVVRRR